jgi:hypothetical protein
METVYYQQIILINIKMRIDAFTIYRTFIEIQPQGNFLNGWFGFIKIPRMQTSVCCDNIIISPAKIFSCRCGGVGVYNEFFCSIFCFTSSRG